MDLILLFVMIFTNSGLASQKGKSPFLWGFLTLAAFLLAMGIFGSIYVFATYKGPLTPENMDGIRDYILSMQKNISSGILIAMLGVGGALIVRYILSRMPDKKRGIHDDNAL